MTAYDVRARTTAGRLLGTIAANGKGQTATITRRTSGAYDVSTGAAAVTTTTQAGSGVEVEYKQRDIDGTMVLEGDRKFFLSPLNTAGAVLTAPAMDDTVTLSDSSVWTIKAVDTLSPAGTAILYVLQLRRN